LPASEEPTVKSVREQFDEFASTLPSDVPEDVWEMLRGAFYAGAGATLCEVTDSVKVVAEGRKTVRAHCEDVVALHGELWAWMKAEMRRETR
jgi:hypothetical protein